MWRRIGQGAGWVGLLLSVAAGWAQGDGATQVPQGARLVLTVEGEGVQIYRCEVAGGRAGWEFVAPEAKLVDATGQTIGNHSAGPTWQLKDGSSVTGLVLAKDPGATPGDVPSLLLRVVSHGGSGGMTEVAFVRRSGARGGVAPAAGCDAAHIDGMLRVPYTARYAFYAAR